MDKINNSSYLCRPVYSMVKVGKLNTYKVELKNMRDDSCLYEYTLDNQFFTNIEAPDIREGSLTVTLSVKKTGDAYALNFHTEGSVTVPCDRCLDDLELPVETDDSLIVKLGTDFSEEEDIITVPEEDGYIDVGWYIYEFIMLSLPIKHVHAPGECNAAMTEVLSQHLATEITEETDIPAGEEDTKENGETDPRWNDLKKILDNN